MFVPIDPFTGPLLLTRAKRATTEATLDDIRTHTIQNVSMWACCEIIR